MSLKSWFVSNQGLALPKEIYLPPLRAISPYDEQIEAFRQQLGVVHPRVVMKDASGASWMESSQQLTYLHGISLLGASKRSLEANFHLALFKRYPEQREERLPNIILNAFLPLQNDPHGPRSGGIPSGRKLAQRGDRCRPLHPGAKEGERSKVWNANAEGYLCWIRGYGSFFAVRHQGAWQGYSNRHP